MIREIFCIKERDTSYKNLKYPTNYRSCWCFTASLDRMFRRIDLLKKTTDVRTKEDMHLFRRQKRSFCSFFSLREPAQLYGRKRTSKPRKSTKSEIYCPWSLEIELRSAICSRNERHQWCFHFCAFRATILPSFLVFFLFFLVFSITWTQWNFVERNNGPKSRWSRDNILSASHLRVKNNVTSTRNANEGTECGFRQFRVTNILRIALLYELVQISREIFVAKRLKKNQSREEIEVLIFQELLRTVREFLKPRSQESLENIFSLFFFFFL